MLRRKKKSDDRAALIDQADRHQRDSNGTISTMSSVDDDPLDVKKMDQFHDFDDNDDDDDMDTVNQTLPEHNSNSNRNSTLSNSTEGDYSTNKTDLIWDDQEKDIYENQLTQLQEQLVSIMIENQALASEIESLKGTDASTLHDQVQTLQKKNTELKRLLEQSKNENDRTSYDREILSVTSFNKSGTGLEVPADQHISSQQTPLEKAREVLLNFFYDFIADFLEDVEDEPEINPDGQQLSVRRLKENMRRCARAYRPFSNVIHSVQDVVLWRNPPLSMLIFIVFMYCTWHGRLLSFILGVFIMQLTLNYLHTVGIRTGIRLFPFYNSQIEDEKSVTKGLSDKFQIVLQIARKVQNLLGSAADIMEKITNFMLWVELDGTKYLMKILCLTFAASILLSSETFYIITGMVLGFKIFITTAIYHYFPKVRYRYDTIFKIWNSLPTNAEIEERSRAASIAREELEKQGHHEHYSGDETLISYLYKLFSLPASEKLIKGWEMGWKCVYVNRNRSIPSYRNGRLYLTDNFICYQRISVTGMRNIKNDHFKIPLSCITNLKKAKQLFFLPGTGTSLKIYSKVEFNDVVQSHLFGIAYRDEAYDSIMQHGRERNLPWAT